MGVRSARARGHVFCRGGGGVYDENKQASRWRSWFDDDDDVVVLDLI